MSENESKKLSPEEVILNAFTYFDTDRITLDSFITIGEAAGSPNPEVTQAVLNSLVKEGTIKWEKDEEGRVWFFIPKTPKDKIQ